MKEGCTSEGVTDPADVGVGEEVHEEVYGAEAEALVVAGERGLQLLVVDGPAAVAVGGLEARDDVGVGPRRERGRHERGERAPVPASSPVRRCHGRRGPVRRGGGRRGAV
jgi:hypothetical protein